MNCCVGFAKNHKNLNQRPFSTVNYQEVLKYLTTWLKIFKANFAIGTSDV